MRIYQPTAITMPTQQDNVSNRRYVDNKIYAHVQTIPALVWVVPHNKNDKRAIVQVFDEDLNEQVMPDEVVFINANTIEIRFVEETRGTASLFFPRI